MIEVTEAVKLARQFAADLFAGEDIKNLGLEEVVFKEPDNEWQITLGYDSYRVKTKETAPSSYSVMSALAPTNIEKETLREYKTFRIGAKDGDFKGMLIRDVG
nr:hypothetical protein [uncultured Psychrobacter sp.]